MAFVVVAVWSVAACDGQDLVRPDTRLGLERVEDDDYHTVVDASVRGEGDAWSFLGAVIEDVEPGLLAITAADGVAWRLTMSVTRTDPLWGDVELLTPAFPVERGDVVDVLTMGGPWRPSTISVERAGALRLAIGSGVGPVDDRALHGSVDIAVSSDVFCSQPGKASCRVAKDLHTTCGDNHLPLVFASAGDRVELDSGEKGLFADGTFEAWNVDGNLIRDCFAEDDDFYVSSVWSVLAVD